MAIYYQISKNGESVYILKTLSEKDFIYQKDFDKKAKKITTEEFISKYCKNNKLKVQKIIDYIKNIHKQDIAYLDNHIYYMLDFEKEDDLIVFDKKTFATEQEALDYGIETFGEDYMIRHKYLNKVQILHIGNKIFVNNYKDAYKYGLEHYGDIFMKRYEHLLAKSDSEHVFLNGEESHDILPEEALKALATNDKLCKITNLKEITNEKKITNKR